MAEIQRYRLAPLITSCSEFAQAQSAGGAKDVVTMIHPDGKAKVFYNRPGEPFDDEAALLAHSFPQSNLYVNGEIQYGTIARGSDGIVPDFCLTRLAAHNFYDVTFMPRWVSFAGKEEAQAHFGFLGSRVLIRPRLWFDDIRTYRACDVIGFFEEPTTGLWNHSSFIVVSCDDRLLALRLSYFVLNQAPDFLDVISLIREDCFSTLAWTGSSVMGGRVAAVAHTRLGA